ncbi:hypothetical protein MHI24_25240 [Paenibacillus sp. FSL K6-1096]
MPARNSANTRVTIQKVRENDMQGTSVMDYIRYPEYTLFSRKNKRKCDI